MDIDLCLTERKNALRRHEEENLSGTKRKKRESIHPHVGDQTVMITKRSSSITLFYIVWKKRNCATG